MSLTQLTCDFKSSTECAKIFTLRLTNSCWKTAIRPSTANGSEIGRMWKQHAPRIPEPFIKTNRSLCGLGFEIRNNFVQSHRVLLIWRHLRNWNYYCGNIYLYSQLPWMELSAVFARTRLWHSNIYVRLGKRFENLSKDNSCSSSRKYSEHHNNTESTTPRSRSCKILISHLSLIVEKQSRRTKTCFHLIRNAKANSNPF